MTEHDETPGTNVPPDDEQVVTPVTTSMSDSDIESDANRNIPNDDDLNVKNHNEAEPESVADETDETFTREYVENLREESAKYRTRAKDRDALAERLHTALVAATGRLADATDLTFDDAHLDDAEALTAAIDDLLATKPHLASRKPSGNIGQGVSGVTEGVDLAGMLRARAS